MNFTLTPERRAMQDALDSVLEAHCDSRALHRFIDSKPDYDTALWRQLADQGALGIAVPEVHGGLGLGVVDLALAAESLGYAAAPVPLHAHWIAALTIAASEDEAQRARWLPGLASGARLATIALCESPAHWMPDTWSLPAEATVDGTKRYVPCATSADLIVVGLKGGRFGVVEARAPGVTIETLAGVDRTRPMADVRFSAARMELLPVGPGTAERIVNAGLAVLAADAFGGARRCLDMAVGYAKLREQFGRKIGAFQALRHQLANLANEVEPCRGLYWFGAYAQDKVPERASHAASLAKAHIGSRYLEAARNAIEYHGGIGYTWDYDCHIWLKRAMLDQAWLGNADLHYLRAAENAGW